MTRRRFALTVLQRMELKQAASGLLVTVAALLTTMGSAPTHMVPALSACVMTLTTAYAAAMATVYLPLEKAEGDYPRRTWHDYAADPNFATEWRFEAADMQRLATTMEIPDTLTWEKGGEKRTYNGDVAFSLLVYRMAQNCKLYTLNKVFGVKQADASRMLDALVDFLYERWYKPLFVTDFKRWAPYFAEWAEATMAAQRAAPGTGVEGIVALVDGHKQGVNRPGVADREFFNGHGWLYCLVYLVAIAPNGLCIDLAGPFEGRHNDQFMLQCSQYLERFKACMEWAVKTGQRFSNGVQATRAWLYQLYSTYFDAGFTIQPFAQVPFKKHPGMELTAPQKLVNKQCARMRVPNEWFFSRTNLLWPHAADGRAQYVGGGKTGKLFIIACMLTNAHTCLYGQQTNAYFDVLPPTLEEYFGGAPAPEACPRAWFEVMHE